VGSGARALGQSAFIAVADDATAASWNPAGLTHLERPEVSFVGFWRSVEEDYSATNPRKFRSPESWSDSEINFMSYAQPLLVGNVYAVLSVNYHQVYDFESDFNLTTTSDLSPFVTVLDQINGESKGAISAYTLAGGLSMPDHPDITIGAGINWYSQSLTNSFAWNNKRMQKIRYTPPSFDVDIIDNETFDNFRAHNFTFGLLWDAYEEQGQLLTLGLVCHTPFTADVDYELNSTSIVSGSPDSTIISNKELEIDFPLSLGAGVKYRFSSSLSAAFDVEWKEWSKFTQKFRDGARSSPVDDDTLAYRLGGEHLFLEGASEEESLIACRGGVFYEPRPLASSDTVPIYGLSAGLGWTRRDQFSLDFAYQYRLGKDDLEDFDYRIEEQLFIVSFTKYF
jgi:long-subunit fatty acid transport protein